MARLYGNLLDPETAKMLQGQALLQFGSNLLSAQPTPYPQGTLSTVGSALASTLPAVNQQAMQFLALKQRDEELRRRAEEEKRKAEKPIAVGGVLLDPKTNTPIFDARQRPDMAPRVVGDALVDPTGKVIYQAPPKPEKFESPYLSTHIGADGRVYGIRKDTMSVEPVGGATIPQPPSKQDQPQKFDAVTLKLPNGQFKTYDATDIAGIKAAVEGGAVEATANAAGKAGVPQQTQLSYSNSVAGMDRMKQSATALKSHPGLWKGTGLGGAQLGSIPGSEAYNFRADLESLKSQVAFSVLQAMREASKTGGALGAVSDREMLLLQANLSALDANQSPEQFKNNLDKLIQYADEAIARLNSAYQKDGENPAPQAGTPPISPVQVNSPADAEALPSGTVFMTPDGRRKVKP